MIHTMEPASDLLITGVAESGLTYSVPCTKLAEAGVYSVKDGGGRKPRGGGEGGGGKCRLYQLWIEQ